jgi:hypothetical protein
MVSISQSPGIIYGVKPTLKEYSAMGLFNARLEKAKFANY